MSTSRAADKPNTPGHVAGVRTYELVCLAALAVLGLSLLQRGHGSWTMLPVGIGLIGIYLRLGPAPILLLVSLLFQAVDAWAHASWASRPGWVVRHQFDLSDLIQCGAVLAYAAAHYRLQGLARSLVPNDPRVKRPWNQAGERLPKRVVQAVEIGLFLAALPFWAVVAQLVWALLPDEYRELGLHPVVWKLIILIWAIGLGFFLAGGLLSYLGREQMSKDEANLFMQDVLWRELRREQRRANRWLAWARLRYQGRLARVPQNPERTQERS
jgi:hypothetical protein